MAAIVLREVQSGVHPEGRAVLHSPFGIISVDLGAEPTAQTGPIAGAEGLGCEFFLDHENCLMGMDLDLHPREVVTLCLLEEIRSVRDMIRAAAAPARVAVDRPSQHAINPDVIWMSPSLDIAIFWFGVPPESCRAFLQEKPNERFLEIGSVAALGLDHHDGSLRLVLVESFAEQQFLFNTPVSARTSGKDFVNVLNALHQRYYASRNPQEFASAVEVLLDQVRTSGRIEPLRDLEKLAEFYQRDLHVARRLAEVRSRQTEESE